MQHRVGADLQEQPRTGARGFGDRGVEAHRFAQVAPPVFGIERITGDLRARDRGNERQPRGTRRERGEVRTQPGLNRVHRRGVEGVVKVEHDAMRPRLSGCSSEPCDGRCRPGNREGFRSVVSGDFQARPAGFEQGKGGLCRKAKRRHAANAASRVLVPAARGHQHRGLVQRERAGGAGGRDLADGMAEHERRGNAVGRKCGDDTVLDGKQQRLRAVGRGQGLGGDALAQQGERRPAEMRRQRGIGLGHRAAEDGVAAQRVARHAGVLRAIAGEDEGKTAARGGALRDALGVALAQPGGKALGHVRAAQHQAMR